MADDLQELKTEVAVFTQRVTSWMDSTTEYRKHLCDKVDKISDKLNALPCGERKGWYQSMGRQVKFLWGITGVALLAIIVEWLKKR